MRKSLAFVCLAVCVTLTHGFCIDDWAVWKTVYGKTYGSMGEEANHKTIWENNVKLVREHNSRPGVAFQMEVNSFADQELSRPPINPGTRPSKPLLFLSSRTAPESWDWRTKGAVGPVISQGQLGDALSIAATECVESFHIINSGKLTSLSAMETHDCCVRQPVASADIFECIHRIGGLCSLADYPTSQGKCMNNSCTAVAKIDGGKLVSKGDEDALKAAVYEEPVMAVIDASHASFQLYRAGVYSEPECSSTRLDHAVQVVGYGSMDGHDYWICRNSWGTSWGMDGYVLIARNKGNMCGIGTMAMYPV